MEYILASSSPRRKELMKEISSSFVIDVSHADESVDDNIKPINAVKIIAKRKGEAVISRHPHDLVISADTIVDLNNEIIGKPIDMDDAKKMLKKLSGKAHLVHTAYCLFLEGRVFIDTVTSEVLFNNLSDELINNYVESKSPLDKAGAYGVQDNEKFPLVKEIKGSVTNVIGFPVEDIKEAIEKFL